MDRGTKGFRFSRKIYFSILLAVTLTVLFLRFLVFNNKEFDVLNFAAYLFVAVFFLLVKKLHENILHKQDEKLNEIIGSTNFKDMSIISRTLFMIATTFVGISICLLQVIPFVCVLVPPLLAIWGVEAYVTIDVLADFLGINFLTSTLQKLLFVSTWYVVGILIVDFEVYFLWKYYNNRGSQSGIQ